MFFPGRIDFAEVSRRADGRPEVRAWDSYAFEGSEMDALKRVRGKLRTRCTTLLRHGEYQLLQVEAPQVPAEERAQALRWRVKEMVDFAIDAAGVEVLDIPGAPGGAGGRAPQVFAVVASHAVLTPRIRLFQDAKIPLAAIDVPELAQRNIAALFEEENRGLALVAFDDDGGRLTFTYRGELYATRRIEVGRKELASPGADRAYYERVLLDVQRSLDNFDRNYSFITLTRLLVAPLPGAAAFIEYLKGNLYQPVELLDLAEHVDLDAVPALAESERQGDALLAIGAALRQ
jgi:MSHA biogenesis protein MshI